MKNDKRAFFITLLFMMVCVMVQAQSLQVEGTVISKSIIRKSNFPRNPKRSV